MKIIPVKKIAGVLRVPGDKSISHRALMFSALAKGKTRIFGLSDCQDVRSTTGCLGALGISITETGNETIVDGKGLSGLQKPESPLDAGNSGTTMRLLSGILAGQNFETTITGDQSLKKRPMRRIILPLRQMGVQIEGTATYVPPLTIKPSKLKPIQYHLPIASAQVKSCVLLAGLYADGETTIIEPYKSRDHTERLFRYLGADLKIKQNKITVSPDMNLNAKNLVIPGDISSAAFFMVAGAMVKNSQITLKNVGINPTRTGILEVLSKMGARFEIVNQKFQNNEPSADIIIYSSQLKGIDISGSIIPRIIDEIPIIAVAATQAKGQTVIRDAQELRYKETDRIRAVVENLKNMGVQVKELPDGLVIEGEQNLIGSKISSYDDHRIAMAFAIAALSATGETMIDNADCVNISYPGFFEQLENLCYD